MRIRDLTRPLYKESLDMFGDEEEGAGDAGWITEGGKILTGIPHEHADLVYGELEERGIDPTTVMKSKDLMDVGFELGWIRWLAPGGGLFYANWFTANQRTLLALKRLMSEYYVEEATFEVNKKSYDFESLRDANVFLNKMR